MLRALDLAEAVENGDLTPATIAALCLEAIEEREAQLNTFAFFDSDAFEIAGRAGIGPIGAVRPACWRERHHR